MRLKRMGITCRGCMAGMYSRYSDECKENGCILDKREGSPYLGFTNKGGPVTKPQVVDFSMFLFSLASSAQLAMGVIPHPETQKTQKNLEAARQTIDIIELLKTKTTGNCTEDETKLMDQLLYTLRMQFVEAGKP